MSRTQNRVVVRVDKLCRSFVQGDESVRVLEDVDLEARRGESIAIMGPSGSGKSTLLHIIGTLDQPTSGQVTLEGENPFDLSDKALARFRNRRIGLVFQDHYLLPQCTALENVLVPTLATRRDRSAMADRARGLLDRLGLTHRLSARPPEMSGGERQRVAIARALINEPALLLCDEPTGNLDRATARTVGDGFVQLLADQQTALLLVTHDPEFARRFDKVYHLRAGRLERAEPGDGSDSTDSDGPCSHA